MANAYSVTGGIKKDDDPLIEYIKYAVFPIENTHTYAYSRYWAGNMTLYKILLIFMSVNGIRSVLLMVILALFVFSAVNIYKLLGKRGILPFLLSMLVYLYIPNSMCMVYSSDIIIMLIAMNVCVWKWNKKNSAESFYFLFFIIGSICVYVNYWAFPLITLGMPLIFWTLLKLNGQYDIRQIIKENILSSICWAEGLGGTVLLKQLLCYIVLGKQSGTSQLFYRMGADMGIQDRFLSTVQGLSNELFHSMIMPIVVSMIVCLAVLLRMRMLKGTWGILSLLLTACYLVAWYFLVAGHNNHGFVRYMFGVSLYGILSAAFFSVKDFSVEDIGSWFVDKKVWLNNGITIGLWVIFVILISNNVIHFDSERIEQWSLENIDYVQLDENTQVIQEVDFDIQTPKYLKSMSTILVNIPEEGVQGKIHIEWMIGEKVVRKRNVDISDIPVGEWFDIPIGYTVYPDQVYRVSYTVVDTKQVAPYLLLQDVSQGVSCNERVYVNDLDIGGVIVNQYEYDEILDGKVKVYILVIMFFVLQLFSSVWEWRYEKDRNAESLEAEEKIGE